MDSSTQIAGKVAQVNAKGLKLEGADSWVNVSKFAENVTMPERGAQVVLTLDKAGFIRKIAAPAPVVAQPVAVPQVAPIAGAQGEAPDKDTVISRLAVLNTATAILSSGSRAADPAAVLALAAQLEAWAHRPA